MSPLRIGCVPYLNAKPLIAWFGSPGYRGDAEIVYEVPSSLAQGLEDGRLDVALVSVFELFRNPALRLVPGISISADGPVKSVRLFTRVPIPEIRSVALDTSSLTSTALTRILLKEVYGIEPRYAPHAPDVFAMLRDFDAGLLIGDLKLFDAPARHTTIDLGEAWKRHTGRPFVYAAWLARDEELSEAAAPILTSARDWGMPRREELSSEWAAKLQLPLERVRDYFFNVMQYDLDEPKLAGLRLFRERCEFHGLIARGNEERDG